MEKKRIFEKIKEKIIIEDAELESTYKKISKQLLDRGKVTEELILNRMYALFIRIINSSLKKYEGVLLGISDNYFFNRNTKLVEEHAKKIFEENPLDTPNGNVFKIIDGKVVFLWHKVDDVDVADFKLGEPITENDYTATAYFLIKEENDFIFKSMRVSGLKKDELLKNMSRYQFKLLSFSALPKDDKINDSKYTYFIVKNEEEIDINKILVKKYKKFCLNLEDIGSYYEENGYRFKTFKNKKIDVFPVFINASVSTFSESLYDNNKISLVDIKYEKSLSVYYPKCLGKITEGTPNVVFGGFLQLDETKMQSDETKMDFVLNSFMAYVPKEYRNLEMIESIEKYREHQEQTIKNPNFKEIQKTEFEMI